MINEPAPKNAYSDALKIIDELRRERDIHIENFRDLMKDYTAVCEALRELLLSGSQATIQKCEDLLKS